MKHFWKKAVSAALAVLMIAPSCGVFASVALGDDLKKEETQLHEGTTYVHETFYSNTYQDLRQEKYVIYEPNDRVKPVVSFGNYILERITTKTAAERLEQSGNVRVIAGMNGDFFGVSSGMPLGSIVSDGIIRVGLQENYAIGFYEDGTAVLGEPKLQMHTEILKADRALPDDISATTVYQDLPEEMPGEEPSGEETPLVPTPFDITAINCVRYSYGGIYLYSRDFNNRQTVGTNETGVDVVCSVQEGALKIGGSVTLRVEQVLENAVDTAVPEGCLVFSANNQAGDTFTLPLRALQPGDELCVRVTAESEKWNDVKELMGALYLLIQDGQVQSGLEAAQAPRTAIGQRSDGTLIFYTIDGRQKGLSVGAGINQVASRLAELGCVTALGLDGGGSTTMLCTYPAGEKADVVNSPSDGSLRRVTNNVLLLAASEPTGEAAHISLVPKETILLPGAVTDLSCRILDTNFLPCEGTPTVTASDGTVEGMTFTAPQTAGEVTLNAAYGDLTQSATVTVIPAPDSLSVYADGVIMGDSLNLTGEQSVALTASAIYRHLPINTDHLPVSWTAEGTAGTLNGNVFTANRDGGTGTLTLHCGALEKKITVQTAAKPLCTLADFEAPFEAISIADGKAELTQNTARNFVRYGSASAHLNYALSPDETLVVPVSYGIPDGYDSVTLWVYGEDRVTIGLQTDCGECARQDVALSGWTRIGFTLPGGAKTVSGITLFGEKSTQGSLYLDEVVATYALKTDDTAPQITGNIADGKLQCTLRDDTDGGNVLISLTANGAELVCAYDAGTGILTAALPGAATLCRITLTAQDASGNLSRWSGEVKASEIKSAFTDTQNHWAKDQVAWLKEAGITNGDGAGHYLPDSNITREEFAALLCRYLHAKTQKNDFAFTDDKNISDWAKESVYTLYRMGIIQGSEENGKLFFNPKANISRQEAVTMLSRLLPKGYTAEAKHFTDTAKIAAWASDAVTLLSTLGVLTGDSDGGFHPNDPLTRAQTAAVLYRMQ